MTSPALKWVKLKKYCELSGDTPSAVRNRRKRGQWLNGVQATLAPDGNLWINLTEVEQWVQPQGVAKPPKRAKG
jgi:hypothetical protein